MTVEQALQLFLTLVALNPFNNFTTFKDDDCWNSSDTILDREFHIVANVDFANFGTRFCQCINDWTQSFARRSAIAAKVNQNGLFRS